MVDILAYCTNSIIYAIYLWHKFDQLNVLLISIDKNIFRNVGGRMSLLVFIYNDLSLNSNAHNHYSGLLNDELHSTYMI